MISKQLINPQHTAVLVIDIQNDYCSSSGEIAKQLGLDLTTVQKVVPKIIDFVEKLLKKNNVKNLIIIGAYTAVCVDTTIRSGFTRGYHIVVPENLVGMPEERSYQGKAAIDVWKIIFAHVVNSEEIISEWEKSN